MSAIDNCPDPAFPRGIGDLIEINRQSQAPFALISSSVLGAISLAMQGTLEMQRLPALESTVHLYLSTLADPRERKSNINRLVFQAIRDFEAKQASDEGSLIFDSRAIGRPGMLYALWGGDPYPVERVIQSSFTLRDVRITFAVMEQPGTLQTFLAGKGATK